MSELVADQSVVAVTESVKVRETSLDGLGVGVSVPEIEVVRENVSVWVSLCVF